MSEDRPAFATRLKSWARRLKIEVAALALAIRDPRTPWYAKAVAFATVAYAVSPLDLIPDFIPVLGFIDDAILLPGAIWLTLRLIPADVMADCRQRAAAGGGLSATFGRAGLAAIVTLWIVMAAAVPWWIWG